MVAPGATVPGACHLPTVGRAEGSTAMDMDGALSSVSDRIDELESLRDELIEVRDWLDSEAMTEYAGVCADHLDEWADELEAAGPDEGETDDRHMAFVEGVHAAAERLREQY